MAEEFQAGICGGNWWSTSRNALLVGGGGGGGGASPCSMAFNDVMGNYGWLTDVVDTRGMKSCDDNLEEHNRGHSNSASMVFPNNDKVHQPTSCGNDSILIDSTLHMMGFGLSSSSTTSDWSQTLLGRTHQGNYNSMIQEDMSSRLAGFDGETGMDPSQIQKEWSPKNFCNGVVEEDSSMNGFKQINQDFSMDQTRTNPITSTANNCPSSCGYPLTLIQSLLEPDPNHNPQQPLYGNDQSIIHLSTVNYGLNSDNSPPSFSKLSPLLKPSSLANNQQPNRLHFSNNAPFWNASSTGIDNIPTGFLASPQPNCSNLMEKPSPEDARESDSSIKKSNVETGFKRPRIETPSPLPTFKVRKEKLGDRITALQQLVSPFGKTDTASVLHEAIDYIKFLHDQVSVLSAPYMKNGSPQQHQQGSDKLKDTDGTKQDLRSRGLCLVPVSSTFPVANETPVDFWTPTFGGTFSTFSRPYRFPG